MSNAELQRLAEEQDLIGYDIAGLDGLGEAYPVIQWTNDKKAFATRRDRGGFTMTANNAEAAGDVPQGAVKDTISFAPTADKPQGTDEECWYVSTLTCAPLATRSAWFLGKERLPQDFDYQGSVAAGRDKPFSRRQILALVQGENGLFLALLTFRSTIAGDVQNALGEHNRAAQSALRAAKISNKAVKTNGWRWFWLTLKAGEVKLRGQEGAQSPVTPVEYGETGQYIGALRQEFFDAETAKDFENAWKSLPPAVVIAPTVTVPPEEPPFDDPNYPEFEQ